MAETVDHKGISRRLLKERRVSYHTSVAKVVGGATPGLFLSQLLYWSGKGADPEGWIYKTQAEMEDETALTRREQETARKKLREKGVLEEDRRGLPAKLHYRIDEDRLYELLDKYRQTSMAESAKLEWRKAPNNNGGKRQSLPYTEITTESTSLDIQGESAKQAAPAPKPRSPSLSAHIDDVQIQGLGKENPVLGEAFEVLNEIPTFHKSIPKNGLKDCLAWLEANDISPEHARTTAFSLAGTSKKYSNYWRTFQNWVTRDAQNGNGFKGSAAKPPPPKQDWHYLIPDSDVPEAWKKYADSNIRWGTIMNERAETGYNASLQEPEPSKEVRADNRAKFKVFAKEYDR